MEVLLTVGFVVLLIICVGLAIILHKQTKKSGGNNEQVFSMLQNQIQELNRTLDTKIGESNKSISDSQKHLHNTIQLQFGQSSKIIGEVSERLTKLDETNKQVVGFAQQLQSLENILKNPKQRGILGEYFLETTLKNVLPPNSYKMQYKFKDGNIVDAAIFLPNNKIVPVDSKFSLENYNRLVVEKDPTRKLQWEKQLKQDLKNRIDETAKYIKPSEDTMDFALMFIPSEGIYYDLLISTVGAVDTHDLIEYAFNKKHVIIVSPTNFYAYLQTIMQGMRALKIEESAKEIRKNVEKLRKHLVTYEDQMRKLGGHMQTSVNFYNRSYKEFGKIDKDVMKITGAEKMLDDVPQLDGVQVDD
ncbi:MAG: DNA recombination protein RmuC [Candidatus Magasanikbacteria bacterium]|nr:DNA recombination protein RmuC [Candidatus Magasanikbacteria bacterium]